MDKDPGESFVQAIAAKDAEAMLDLLTPGVEFRGMTPGRFWESNSAKELVNDVILGRWFEETDRIDAIDVLDTDSVAGRRRIGYRFRVTNPDGTFLVEQQAYYDVYRGRIEWLRIMCAGYRRVTPPAG